MMPLTHHAIPVYVHPRVHIMRPHRIFISSIPDNHSATHWPRASAALVSNLLISKQIWVNSFFLKSKWDPEAPDVTPAVPRGDPGSADSTGSSQQQRQGRKASAAVGSTTDELPACCST